MRALAWILGLVGFIASAFLSVSYTTARGGAHRASAAVSKAEEDLSYFQRAAEMEVQNHQAAVENDELAIHGDDLDLQIARLQRRSTSQAQAKLSADRMTLVVDQSRQRLDEIDRTLGPETRVTSAEERLQSAQQSLAVYSTILVRDEHLAYAVAVVWLAFGFAAALNSKPKSAQIRSSD